MARVGQDAYSTILSPTESYCIICQFQFASGAKLPRSTTYEIWVPWMKRDTDAFPASLYLTTSWVPRTASAHHASMLSAVWIHVINSWSLGEWKEIANMSDA